MQVVLSCASCGTDFSVPRHSERYRKTCSVQCYAELRKQNTAKRLATGLRKCSLCGHTKSTSDFSPGSLGKLHGWCKLCRSNNEGDRRKRPDLVSRMHDRYETDMDFRASRLLAGIKKKCRRHGLACDLDVEWLSRRMTAGVCELSGVRFDMNVRQRKATIKTPSVDRINAGGGYTKDNCRLVAFGVNFALSSWGLDAFLELAEGLVSRHGTKKETTCAA